MATIPVVVAGIQRGRELLFLRRRRKPFAGLWSLPGGKIEPGEFVSDAVMREVTEETALRLKDAILVGLVSEMVFDAGELAASHLICAFSSCAYSGELGESAEGELQWFPRKELAERKTEIVPTDFMIATEIFPNSGFQCYRSRVESGENGYRMAEWAPVSVSR